MDFLEGIRYLDCEDLIACNKAALELTPKERHICHRNLLEGAQQRPAQYKYFAQCCDVFQLAAKLFISIIEAHAFENGNKRTGFLASQVFLEINGYRFNPHLHDTLKIATSVATGVSEYCDPELLSSWFKSFSQIVEDYENVELAKEAPISLEGIKLNFSRDEG